ncbi:fimbria/pilus periplasmic chaperone [Pantoea sp.]|uniref:fimbria/pilus periplasmic chaperone n=1 Tax=Pantoea sp. TaxID=69393 RepID=UPI0031CF41F9
MFCKINSLLTSLIIGAVGSQSAQAAISLDRTRIVFDSTQKSLSLRISNENKKLPYLAQGWLEDAEGKKITAPLVVLPPVQRVEPGASSQIKIQGLPSVATLPQDRESLFFFNLREIPPKSSKPNTLQIALQTRIKLFYRPAAIIADKDAAPWQEQLTLKREGDKYRIYNPTNYYITLVEGRKTVKGKAIENFKPVMMAPKSAQLLTSSVTELGSSPVINYVNDYGARPKLQFTCLANECKAKPIE